MDPIGENRGAPAVLAADAAPSPRMLMVRARLRAKLSTTFFGAPLHAENGSDRFDLPSFLKKNQ